MNDKRCLNSGKSQLWPGYCWTFFWMFCWCHTGLWIIFKKFRARNKEKVKTLGTCLMLFKVSIWPAVFNWYLCYLKLYSNQKNEFRCFFAIKFPASATPNEVDRIMEDWWRMTSLQEHVKLNYFAFLTAALFQQSWFVWFLSMTTPNHYWNESELN